MKHNYFTNQHLFRLRPWMAVALLVTGYFCSAIRLYAQPLPELIYFKFNSVSGSNVPNDANPGTRVSVNGTLSGATVGGTGMTGTALLGNGGASGSNTINSNWALSLPAPWTIFLWVSGVTNTAAGNYVFGGAGGSSFRAFTGTGLVSGGGNLLVRGTGLTDVPINGVFNSSGSPVAIHIVYDNSIPAIKTYVNGVFNSSVTQAAALTLTGTDFRVGGYSSSTGMPSGGKIDEFRLYNRALSASEIATTWNIELNSGPPCPAPTGLVINNFNSQGASFSWSGVTGSAGYDYVVDQNSGAPAVSGTNTLFTNGSVGGLTPSTLYYVHVRNRCSGTSFSQWTTISFNTRPPCSTPTGFTASNIDTSSADISWSTVSTASPYQYVVDLSKTNPPASAPNNTSANGAHIVGLSEGTTYYVHIRSLCAGNDSSAWSLDSFKTPVPCRAAKLELSNLGSNYAVLHWPSVYTAYGYEYAVDESPTTPSVATPTSLTYIQASSLVGGMTYYMHVRCKCEFANVKSISPWATLGFQTKPPASVNDITATGNSFIHIFPNPVNDVAYIKLGNMPGNNAYYILSDVTGRVLKQANVTDDKFNLDLTSLPSGVYNLKYTDNSRSEAIRFNKY